MDDMLVGALGEGESIDLPRPRLTRTCHDHQLQ